MDEETAFRLGFDALEDEPNPFNPIAEPVAFKGWELGREAYRELEVYSEMIHFGN